MAEETKLEARSRDVSGSAAARRLRGQGLLPGILYGGKGKPHLIQTNRHTFVQMLRHHASESLIIDLSVDGKRAKKVLLKEVQHDPLTDEAIHADFVQVSMTKRMRVNVPVTLVGEPVGVTQGGGILDHVMRELEVECLPTDLVEEIVVDVSGLDVAQSLQVKDLDVDPKLTVLTDGDIAVAGVLAPHVVAEGEEGEEEAAAAEGEEPEVIGEKPEGEPAEERETAEGSEK